MTDLATSKIFLGESPIGTPWGSKALLDRVFAMLAWCGPTTTDDCYDRHCYCYTASERSGLAFSANTSWYLITANTSNHEATAAIVHGGRLSPVIRHYRSSISGDIQDRTRIGIATVIGINSRSVIETERASESGTIIAKSQF
ncbi:hypothetical protein EVAR_82196_1 [Eumeta japonica]|uniref:Uncharacterized protein n=1 Tax=Eumeta variegata TaxID=151549 RepID=A0A4C1W4D8_EUMVA|nr:hypothetical protein EVAR_82196_1 [Eumeta japonica]